MMSFSFLHLKPTFHGVIVYIVTIIPLILLLSLEQTQTCKFPA